MDNQNLDLNREEAIKKIKELMMKDKMTVVESVKNYIVDHSNEEGVVEKRLAALGVNVYDIPCDSREHYLAALIDRCETALNNKDVKIHELGGDLYDVRE